MDNTSNTHASNQAERKLAALLNATVDAIIMIDHRGHIEAFNHAAEKIFGYASTEIIGKKINLLMPAPFRSAHDKYISNYLNTGEPKIIGIGREVVAQRKGGSTFPIDLSVGEFFDGAHPHFVGIIRDITERKQIEVRLQLQTEELLQQRERLAHVDRIGIMGEMVTGIAHEINQPLSAISTYAQACRYLLNNATTDRTELSEILDKISSQAERAGEVIRRLRTFLKKGNATRVHIPLNSIIREVIKMAEPDIKLAGVHITTQLHTAETLVNADSIQIQQVLLNLIRNSIDAMQEHPILQKVITITTTPESSEEAIKISVCDNGPGINSSAHEHIFHPFFTTKSTGMGMGLSICHSIISRHGGKMGFKNNLQSGVSFYFTLPTSINESATDSQREQKHDT